MFRTLGKISRFSFTVHNHIDASVDAVALAPRRISFGLIVNVEQEIAELLAADVIEPATGPIPWATTVAIVFKTKAKVRLRDVPMKALQENATNINC